MTRRYSDALAPRGAIRPVFVRPRPFGNVAAAYIYETSNGKSSDMAAAALLVIDAQESFRTRPYFREDGFSSYLSRQQALIDGARAAGLPLIQVFHVEEQGPFSQASGSIRTLEPIRLSPDAVFRKSRHSAFVGSGLDVWLTTNGIGQLLVSGIRTEQCCETTARHAFDLGYQVSFVAEATLTFPMIDAGGREWSAAEIRARTELVLAERFARIVSVEEGLADVAQPLAA